MQGRAPVSRFTRPKNCSRVPANSPASLADAVRVCTLRCQRTGGAGASSAPARCGVDACAGIMRLLLGKSRFEEKKGRAESDACRLVVRALHPHVFSVATHARSTSATLHACAIHPRGV